MLSCEKNTKDNSNCNEAKNHNLTRYAHSQIQFCPSLSEESSLRANEFRRTTEELRRAVSEQRKKDSNRRARKSRGEQFAKREQIKIRSSNMRSSEKAEEQFESGEQF